MTPYNPLKYTDPSGYRRQPDGWDQPWVALNGGISPGGRMDPGSGKHWSDGFRGVWGNFMLGNQGAYDGMYGQGAYNNFVNNVYPNEKKQTSHDDRLLMHFVGFKWNPVAGVEVERGGDDGDLRIYCSGSWQKKDGRPEEDDPAEQKRSLIAELFGKYNAGFIADKNSNQIFPNQTYTKEKVVTRYMIEGIGVWILGMVDTGLGAVLGGLAVTIQGQELILQIKAGNYMQNGQGMGIFVINISATGAIPRAVLFNAADGSSIGWHHTIIKGALTMQYHIYLKLLQELQNVR